jgi:hypothetical protein
MRKLPTVLNKNFLRKVDAPKYAPIMGLVPSRELQACGNFSLPRSLARTSAAVMGACGL